MSLQRSFIDVEEENRPFDDALIESRDSPSVRLANARPNTSASLSTRRWRTSCRKRSRYILVTETD